MSRVGENLMKDKSSKTNNKKRIPAIIIVLGIFCPVIFILYFLIQYNSDIAKVKSDFIIPSSKLNATTEKHSIDTYDDTSIRTNESEKKFIFRGGDGNLYESGGVFCDWAGNYVCWGDCFTDNHGYLVKWGNPFYDNKGNYVGWGNPFYDAKNNYINPKG